MVPFSQEENLLGLNWSEDLIFTFFDWDRIGKHTFIGSARISPMALHILAEGSFLPFLFLRALIDISMFRERI